MADTKRELQEINDFKLMLAINFIDDLENDIIDGEHPFTGDLNDGKVIFNIEEVNQVISELSRNSTLTPRLNAMLKEGNYRPIAMVNDDLITSIITLSDKFPNFTKVIERYQKAMILAVLSTPAPIYLPPLLLVGPPGIGKTRFLCELATILGLGFFQVDMATTSAGFVLAGSSTSWSEGKPGLISNAMRKSHTANPIILIDEIDKVSGDSHYDPLGCLYTLLEHDTAKRFKDEALTISMDCSAINWVASANDLEKIPLPIKSRFTVYEVEKPTREQMPAVVNSVYADLLAAHPWGNKFESQLSDDVINKLVEINPRMQKSVLYDACSEAAYKRDSAASGRLAILADDVILLDKSSSKQRMGFY